MLQLKCVFVMFFCLSCCNAQQNGNAQSNVISSSRNMMSPNGPFLPEQRDLSLEYRPCPDYSLDCIRQYFAAHSKYCKVTNGRVPEPVFRAESTLFFSTFNITVTQYGVDIYRLDGRVTEFYINEETDLAVLQVEFVGVALNSSLDVYRYDRPGRFPAITRSNSRVRFSSFRTTTVFRGVDKLNLATSYTTGFIDNTPTIYVNPSAGIHPDPRVPRVFAQFVSRPNIVVQEAFLTAAPFYAVTYIQCTICDFGLKIL